MNVLWVCDDRPHGHCYGVDFLIQGCYRLLGPAAVYEAPEKVNLHLPVTAERDACRIESDAWLPSKGTSLHDIADLLRSGTIDCVFTTPYGTEQPWTFLRPVLPRHIPVIGLQVSDERHNLSAQLADMVGRPLTAYFQREEATAHNGQPLWLSQPAERVRPITSKPLTSPMVFYRGASGADWNARGPRQRMLEAVSEAVGPSRACLTLTGERESHLPGAVYRERLWHACVSLVWNSHAPGFPVWDSNRFWESLALGCAVIAEYPLYDVPPDLPGVTWIHRPEDAGVECRRLLDDPAECVRLASLSQAAFLRSHTSERRMEALLAAAGCAL